MKIYKRRGCLPSRFISKTKVEAPRGKEVAIHPFRSIQASKNGKKAVPGWPTEGNRARDYTEIVRRSHGDCTGNHTGNSRKESMQKTHKGNFRKEVAEGALQQRPAIATHGGNSQGQPSEATPKRSSPRELVILFEGNPFYADTFVTR